MTKPAKIEDMGCTECTKRGFIDYLVSVVSSLPIQQRQKFVERDVIELKREYCTKYCQVTKFNRKYSKTEEPLGMDGYIPRERLSSRTYLFEGGIQE